MANSNNSPDPIENEVWYTSEGCDVLIIREEDTQPGKPSARLRQWMEEKWGRKPAPDQPDQPNEEPKGP